MYIFLKYKIIYQIASWIISIYFNIFSPKMSTFAPYYSNTTHDTKPG